MASLCYEQYFLSISYLRTGQRERKSTTPSERTTQRQLKMEEWMLGKLRSNVP